MTNFPPPQKESSPGYRCSISGRRGESPAWEHFAKERTSPPALTLHKQDKTSFQPRHWGLWLGQEEGSWEESHSTAVPARLGNGEVKRSPSSSPGQRSPPQLFPPHPATCSDNCAKTTSQSLKLPPLWVLRNFPPLQNKSLLSVVYLPSTLHFSSLSVCWLLYLWCWHQPHACAWERNLVKHCSSVPGWYIQYIQMEIYSNNRKRAFSYHMPELHILVIPSLWPQRWAKDLHQQMSELDSRGDPTQWAWWPQRRGKSPLKPWLPGSTEMQTQMLNEAEPLPLNLDMYPILI